MKYSYMSFSTPDLSLDDMLAAAKRFGYDGVEPRLDCRHKHGVEVDASADQRRKIRETFRKSGVALACVATSLSYADPAKKADMLAQTHARIDLAGDIGSPTLRVFGGVIPQGVTREQATDLLVECLGGVAGHAAQRGVTLCLETHDHWCDPSHVAVVLKRVGHPAIAVNWDIMHPVRAAKVSIEKSFEILKPWIRHLHIHDGTMEDPCVLKPIGQGAIDHRRAVELLAASRYGGFISGEWIGWESYEVHLPRELATLKQYEREAK